MKIGTHYAYGCKLYLKLLRRVIQLNHSPAFNKRKSGKSSRTLSGFETRGTYAGDVRCLSYFTNMPWGCN